MHTVFEGLGETLADLVLVVIRRRAINVPVAQLDRIVDSLIRLLRQPPGSKANLRTE